MIPLRLHSDFSLLKAMAAVPKYPRILKEAGFKGGALTDFDSGFGWVDFYFKMKSAELKPILGTHLNMSLLAGEKSKGGVSFLVTNKAGYQNLNRILSAYSFGTLNFEKLMKWNSGIIAMLSPDHPHLLKIDQFVEEWPKENLYFEAQRFEGAAPESLAIQASEKYSRPCVGTAPCYFFKPDDFLSHEVLMSIGTATTLDDDNRPKLKSKDFFFKSEEELINLFSDRPDFIEATEEIFERCDFSFQTGKFFLPSIGAEAEVSERFNEECKRGLDERLELVRPNLSEEEFKEAQKVYRERLDFECKIIQKMNFEAYFLIVADFIQWSKSHDIPVGPGRGSGAGSLAAYSLKITDIDPIRYNLLFERFLNPERVSMPDFDVDFCIKGRDRVIQYVRDKYNIQSDDPDEERLKVAQIITYGKMKSKAVIRDVGRVLGMGYSDVDAIAKLIPPVLNITLEEAYEQEPEFEKLRDRDRKADQLLDIAEHLEGLNRHTSVHAAGVVIADDVLTNHLPLHAGSDSEIVCQFEMKAVETIGLVKFDFLGLRNLTVIQECIRLTGKEIDLLKIDYNDPAVMKEIGTGETVGVFQLESSGMRDVIRRLQPSVFEDLIAIVALYRPGPLEGGMVDDFILRKRGQKPVTYPHKVLEPILKETYGVFVYQEQVMGTANLMAGFSLGEADLLRRAMGKKIAEEMAKQRVKFVEGSKSRGYEEDLAQRVFDLMSEFAKYGFNKSHAAAYAMITFQTAYLKTYYPEAFFAALLTSESEDTEKLGYIIRTAKKRGVEIMPPHVNYSDTSFSIKEKKVWFGLSAIKNLGANVAKAIVTEREANGPYKNYENFFFRMPAGVLNKRQSECLIRSGALDDMGMNRSSLFASMESLVGSAHAEEKARSAGQGSLFKAKPRIKDLEEWGDKIRLSDEKHLLGTYMTGHPMASLRSIVSSYNAKSIQEVCDAPAPSSREIEVSVAGIIISKKEIITKKGKKMAFFSVEDLEAQIEIVTFPDLYAKKGDVIVNDRLVLVRGQVVKEGGATRLLAREISDISNVEFSQFCIRLKSSDQVQFLEPLLEQAKKYSGGIPLKVLMPVETEVEGSKLKNSFVTLDTEMNVQTNPQLINFIESQFGEGSIELS